MISFRIPEGIDPMGLLEHEFALDGNQALFTVTEVRDGQEVYFDAQFGEFAETLSRGLSLTQRKLVTYLRERGFEPQFA